MYMKRGKIDFVKLLKGQKRGWVAISSDHKKVLVSGRTLKEIIQKAKNLDQSVYYFPVEKSYSDFVGRNF